MEPRLSTAAMAVALERYLLRSGASMEPRANNRGNLLPAMEKGPESLKLQWSRGVHQYPTDVPNVAFTQVTLQ